MLYVATGFPRFADYTFHPIESWFGVLFAVFAVIWVVSLVLYSLLVGGIDFGSLGIFSLKSAGLVAVVVVVMFIPFGGWLALAVWWVGAVLVCGMEFWEAKVLVLIVWALSFLLRLALFTALVSAR